MSDCAMVSSNFAIIAKLLETMAQSVIKVKV